MRCPNEQRSAGAQLMATVSSDAPTMCAALAR